AIVPSPQCSTMVALRRLLETRDGDAPAIIRHHPAAHVRHECRFSVRWNSGNNRKITQPQSVMLRQPLYPRIVRSAFGQWRKLRHPIYTVDVHPLGTRDGLSDATRPVTHQSVV